VIKSVRKQKIPVLITTGIHWWTVRGLVRVRGERPVPPHWVLILYDSDSSGPEDSVHKARPVFGDKDINSLLIIAP